MLANQQTHDKEPPRKKNSETVDSLKETPHSLKRKNVTNEVGNSKKQALNKTQNSSSESDEEMVASYQIPTSNNGISEVQNKAPHSKTEPQAKSSTQKHTKNRYSSSYKRDNLEKKQTSNGNDGLDKPLAIIITASDDMMHEIEEEKLTEKLNSLEIKIRRKNIVNNRVYLYPETSTDAQAILNENSELLKGCPRIDLETKATYLLLFEISFNEINENENVAKFLKSIGITEWQPLLSDADCLSVKCQCNSRQTTGEILEKYYIDGFKVVLNSNLSTKVTVEPDVPNPLQCYNCFKLTNHVKSSCPNKKMC